MPFFPFRVPTFNFALYSTFKMSSFFLGHPPPDPYQPRKAGAEKQERAGDGDRRTQGNLLES
jgi:hypothetical protein